MSVAKALELVKQMSVMELVEFISAAEKEFNVSAQSMAMPMMGMPMVAGAGGAAAAEEKTEFTVKLKSAGANKVNAIKVVREITSLGLKEAKDLVEAAPSNVKEGVSKQEAEEIVKKLKEAGAEAEIQ